MARPGCLKDPWTRSLHRDVDFGTRRGRLKLVAHALTAMTSIVPQECKNASICRYAKTRVQTHQRDIMQVSTQLVGKHFRHTADTGPSVDGRDSTDAVAQKEEQLHGSTGGA
jgi:hypothetical protein